MAEHDMPSLWDRWIDLWNGDLEQASEMEAEQVSSLNTEAEQPTLPPTGQLDQAQSRRSESPPKSEVQKAVLQPTQSTKCTFFGTVPIDLKRFQESGVSLVECPDCASMRTLEPRGGILRFKSHDKRKTTTANTGQRWIRIDADWNVLGE